MMRSISRWSGLVLLSMAACTFGDHRHGLHNNLAGHLEFDDAGESPPDLAEPPLQADLGTFGCSGLVNCISACGDNTCANACLASTTQQGQSLFFAVQSCMMQACPQAVSTDPCFDPASAACNTCLNNAQTGA